MHSTHFQDATEHQRGSPEGAVGRRKAEGSWPRSSPSQQVKTIAFRGCDRNTKSTSQNLSRQASTQRHIQAYFLRDSGEPGETTGMQIKGGYGRPTQANPGILCSQESEWGWPLCSNVKDSWFHIKWKKKKKKPSSCNIVNMEWLPFLKCVCICIHMESTLE